MRAELSSANATGDTTANAAAAPPTTVSVTKCRFNLRNAGGRRRSDSFQEFGDSSPTLPAGVASFNPGRPVRQDVGTRMKL
jgi:hypothetical protein